MFNPQQYLNRLAMSYHHIKEEIAKRNVIFTMVTICVITVYPNLSRGLMVLWRVKPDAPMVAQMGLEPILCGF